jgi:leader peptidase (prepilin peptidase)/N-methyltransferase
VVLIATAITWSAMGATTAALSTRAAYRLSVPRGQPPAGGCSACGAVFRAGIRGWLPARRCGLGCYRPWWTFVGVGALVCGLLAVRLTPADPAGWALLVAWSILTQAGLLLSAIDIAVHRLPTGILIATAATIIAAIATASALRRSGDTLAQASLGALALGLTYTLIFLLNPQRIGAGDVRLAAVTGLTLGSCSWTTLILGATLPYLLAMPLALWSALRQRDDRRESDQIPFGPFLVGGAIIAAAIP